MLLIKLYTGKDMEIMCAGKCEIIVGSVAPRPFRVIGLRKCGGIHIVVHNIAVKGEIIGMDERRVIVQTEIAPENKPFKRLHINPCISEKTPYLQCVITVEI